MGKGQLKFANSALLYIFKVMKLEIEGQVNTHSFSSKQRAIAFFSMRQPWHIKTRWQRCYHILVSSLQNILKKQSLFQFQINFFIPTNEKQFKILNINTLATTEPPVRNYSNLQMTKVTRFFSSTFSYRFKGRAKLKHYSLEVKNSSKTKTSLRVKCLIYHCK